MEYTYWKMLMSTIAGRRKKVRIKESVRLTITSLDRLMIERRIFSQDVQIV